MSWRIEQTHPLHLLQELPDRWAQACISTPPADMPAQHVLTVLEEIHRVLRDDGTVWLALHDYPDTHELIWQLRKTTWLRPLPANTTPAQTLLLAKHTGFLFAPPRERPSSGLSRRPACKPPRCEHCGRRTVQRRGTCTQANLSPGRSAIAWCVLASTTPRACHVCGNPAVRGRRQWSRRPACPHTGGEARGRCLIIDPFCSTGSTGIAAVKHGRHYLGIEPDWLRAEITHRRLARLEQRS